MPVFEEFSDYDTLTINWNVENFSLHSCTMGKSISSPEFFVNKLGYSYWQLQLFPSGSNNHNYIACYVVAEVDSNKEGYRNRSHYESYRLTLSLRVDDTDFFEIHETWCSLNTSVWKCDDFIRREVLRPIHLSKDTLSIRCVIKPQPSVRDKIHIQNFKYLSQNLISLLDSEKYYDLVLVTEDNTRFKVHKCILSTRWPTLPKVLIGDLATDYSSLGSEILVPNINSDTLETMIRYVYSGIINGQDVPQDLYIASAELDFWTLSKNLTCYPKTYFGITKLIADHKTVEWHLDDVRSWVTKPPSFTRILPVMDLKNCFDIILVFSICTDAEGDRAVDIAFRLSAFEDPIFINCKISLSVQNGEALAFREAKHLFQTNDFWHFPQPLKIHEIPHKRSLITMEITTSDGGSIHINTSETEFFTNFTPIVDLLKLSSDMYWLGKMVNSFAFYPSDCTLVGPNLQVLEVHCAVLWARWPQLRHKLDELGEDKCIIMSIEDNLLAEIILYVYSGHSKNISYETAVKVLEINKTVPLPDHLLVACRAILDHSLYNCIAIDVMFNQNDALMI